MKSQSSWVDGDIGVYVKRGTCWNPVEASRNHPEPPGTFPEAPGTLTENQNDKSKIKKNCSFHL